MEFTIGIPQRAEFIRELARAGALDMAWRAICEFPDILGELNHRAKHPASNGHMEALAKDYADLRDEQTKVAKGTRALRANRTLRKAVREAEAMTEAPTTRRRRRRRKAARRRTKPTRHLSAAARKSIGDAQRARWAAYRAKNGGKR